MMGSAGQMMPVWCRRHWLLKCLLTRLMGCFAITALLGGCAATESSSTKVEPVDLLIYNAQVLSLDEQNSQYSAVAVAAGRIVAVGSDSLHDRYAANKLVDAEQKTLIPGFIDSHIHISGEPDYYIDLTKVGSIEEMQALVAAKAATVAPPGWITGYGWSEDELSEGRKPNRDDLDAVAPAHKVMLTRAGAHSAVVNSNALTAVGWQRNSPDPENGTLERDESGRLTGIVRERQDLVAALIPKPSHESVQPSLVGNLQALFQLGITSIVEAMTAPEDYVQWQNAYANYSGQLPRAAVQIEWRGTEKMRAFGMVTGEGDEWLRVGPAKLFVDGGFTGPAAYTSQPYKNQGEYRGKLTMTPEALGQSISEAHFDGWQLGIHAIGDAAIDLTVAALAEVLAKTPRPDHRHYLNHFTVMPTDQTLQTMAELDIAITQQPNFTHTLEGRYVANLDGARLETNNPLRTPMNAGIHLALSSDILPIGPAVGLFAATTRQGMSGRVFGAEEALTTLEALRGYTIKGAYLTREEKVKGSIEVGKYADLVLLEQNPLTMEPNALMDLRVHQTYLAGELVFSANDTQE